MSQPLVFEGPRLLRPDERRASDRLSQVCFGHSFETEEQAETGPTNGETHVITHQGTPVSQIMIFTTSLKMHEATLMVGSVGGVCTHPDYRQFGLATRLLEHCARRLVEKGARLMVVSGGRGLYLRAGCVPMGKYADFRLKPGQTHKPQANLKLRLLTVADAPLCSRIYHAEPVHFVRPIRRFAESFQSQQISYQAEKWLVELDGCPAAYLILNVPWEFIRQPEAGIREVLEYAGSRVAIALALVEILETGPVKDLRFPVPWQDLDLILLLKSWERKGQSPFCAPGLPLPEWRSLPDHTIRVIDFPGLMDDIHPLVRARLDPAMSQGLHGEQSGPLLGMEGGDHFALVRGKERLELDGAAMTRLVMGETGSAHISANKVPGALADIIAALFPLPSFFPGLDYH